MSCAVAERPTTPGRNCSPLQLIENCLREDLTDLEQARAFRSLMDSNGWSTHQLAKELGIAQPNVVRAVAMLKLPAPVRAKVEAGELSPSAAYAISGIDDVGRQAEVAARVVAEGLSRDETVDVVRRVKASGPARGKPGKGGGAKARPGPALVRERTLRRRPGSSSSRPAGRASTC